MSEIYFDHLSLLVQGLSLLNKSSISPHSDVPKSRNLLTKLVRDFQILYGVRNMTQNVHQLQDLSNSVENLGPLLQHAVD